MFSGDPRLQDQGNATNEEVSSGLLRERERGDWIMAELVTEPEHRVKRFLNFVQE
jgi:hypothetical protein